MISKGFLKQAKKKALGVITNYLSYAQKNIPIVGLEPSCILTLRDELLALVPGKDSDTIAQATFTFDEFVADRIKKSGQSPFKHLSKKVYFHGHCHQKSLVGTEITHDILKAVPDLDFEEIKSGCCGLAGSFGYEKEHYALSMEIGEDRLFPAIRNTKSDSLIIANGLSCRSQIEHGTQRHTYHLAEVLSMALRD